MKPRLSLWDAVAIAGPTAKWEGNCFGIASLLAPHVGGVAVYGHWLGKVSEDGFWAKRARQPFQAHGWVVLPNEHGVYGETSETILDPTRWSFEARKPYLWSGPNDGTYDEGGNRDRFARLGSPPDLPNDDYADFPVSEDILDRLGDFVREDLSAGVLKSQVIYIAHLPPDKIGWFFVAEVYEAIAEAGFKASIPIDNWKMVDRRRGITG